MRYFFIALIIIPSGEPSEDETKDAMAQSHAMSLYQHENTTPAEVTSEELTRDVLESGEWEVKTYTGLVGASLPADNKVQQSYKKCQQFGESTTSIKDTILELISHSQCDSARARVSDGSIAGTLICPGMDDIPEHPEPISGNYSREFIRVYIDYPVYGSVVRQRLEFRRLGDCQH